jgi:hypothetical protein
VAGSGAQLGLEDMQQVPEAEQRTLGVDVALSSTKVRARSVVHSSSAYKVTHARMRAHTCIHTLAYMQL